MGTGRSSCAATQRTSSTSGLTPSTNTEGIPGQEVPPNRWACAGVMPCNLWTHGPGRSALEARAATLQKLKVTHCPVHIKQLQRRATLKSTSSMECALVLQAQLRDGEI